MSLSPGTKLGRYEIKSKIGEGGMGEVYRARDEKLNRDVAIKVLPPSFSENTERLHRFEQEAQAAGTLNHPNILAVYDVGTHDASPYVVAELLEGEGFRDLLSHGALPPRRAIDYATQIAHGLAAAHEKNIIHRDLKPDNLYLTKDDRVKILDFGLAKLNQPSPGVVGQTDIATRKVHTDPGTVMGTVGYMSPEQVRAGNVDHRADIFSLGAVFYEMLAGRRAFRGDSAIETLNAILKEDPPDLTTTNVNIPPALERVVWHCLEKNPERRFQSAKDVAFAIESLSGATSHTSQETVTQLSRLKPTQGWSRERLIWMSVCALLLASVAVLGFLYSTRSATESRLVRLGLSTPAKGSDPGYLTISPDGQRVVFTAANSEGKRVLWIRELDSLVAQPIASTEEATAPFWSPDSRFVGYFATQKLLRVEASGGRPQVLCDVTDDRGGSWNRDGVIVFAGAEGMYRVSAQGGTPQLITKISPQEEAHRWPSFLPDGKHFVFLADAPTTENHKIRVGSIDSQETQILFPAVSRVVYAKPGYLLYVNQSALVSVPFDADSRKTTGDPVTVVEHVAEFGSNHAFDFSASDEGTLAYHAGNPNDQLEWFDRTGKKLATVGEPSPVEVLALSPDGHSAAVGRLDADGRSSDVWLYDLSGGKVSRMTFDPRGDGSPVWSPDGTQIVFGSNRIGGGSEVDLFKKSANGVGEETLLFKSADAKYPSSWSPDGQSILFENSGALPEKTGIWILSLSNNNATPLLQSKSFDQGEGQFSTDGHFIAYTSDESGRPEVYVRRYPLTSERWQISSGGGIQPLWRGDDKELFFLTEDKKLMSVEIKGSA
ncbi:MAG: hypothetical protein C5B55_06040, partial [Blastocatellia bacterium]